MTDVGKVDMPKPGYCEICGHHGLVVKMLRDGQMRPECLILADCTARALAAQSAARQADRVVVKRRGSWRPFGRSTSAA